MGLPSLSPEERQAALRKAALARRVRADLKDRLRKRLISIEEVLAQAKTDETIAKLKVIDLLQSLPGIGEVRAKSMMAEIGIAPSRRLRGLGTNQTAGLIHQLQQRG
ncbi:integration host factor [soil metagenome]